MVNATYEHSGSKQPTVQELIDVLSVMPPTAKVMSLHVEESQKDGWWWRVQARQEALPPLKPLGHHPPGVRSIKDSPQA